MCPFFSLFSDGYLKASPALAAGWTCPERHAFHSWFEAAIIFKWAVSAGPGRCLPVGLPPPSLPSSLLPSPSFPSSGNGAALWRSLALLLSASPPLQQLAVAAGLLDLWFQISFCPVPPPPAPAPRQNRTSKSVRRNVSKSQEYQFLMCPRLNRSLHFMVSVERPTTPSLYNALSS